MFKVLPTAFAEMPAGRIIGTLFFILLVLAALTPTLAGMEPLVAWLEQRQGYSRARAAICVAAGEWLLGLSSVLSFNVWAHWHPFGWIGRLRQMTVFDTADYVSSNVLLPVGALLIANESFRCLCLSAIRLMP